MILKKEWKFHILLAVVLVVMDYFEDYISGGTVRFLKNFKTPYVGLIISFYITSITIYFINFKIVCPVFLKKNKNVYFLGAVLMLIVLFAGIRFLLEEVILYQFTGKHNYYDDSRKLAYYIFDNSYYAVSPILYSTLIYLTLRFMEVKDHNKAELDVLKSQISPHFLFNTLNAFYVELIDDKPETAKDIHRLSELLRYVTYDSQQDFVSLKSEITFLKDYIHIFNKRFENEFSVNFSIQGEVENQQVASLILIHFVENLFKHGVVNDKNDPAEIYIDIGKNDIILKTKNKILYSEKHMGSGIGSDNIKRRLTALFNSNYDLQYKSNDPYFSAYLKMPL